MGRSPSSLVTRPQKLRVEALQLHRRVLQVAFPEPSKAPRCRAMSWIWTLRRLPAVACQIKGAHVTERLALICSKA